MSIEVEPDFSTFEITLPKGVNQDTLSLFGLGNALGWNIKERMAMASDLKRDNIPSYLEVSPEDLNEISIELWNTEIYGENALRFIGEEIQDFNKRYYVYTQKSKEDGNINAASDLSFHYRISEDRYDSSLGTYPSRLRSYTGDDRREQEQLEKFIARIWPRTPYPFESPKVVKSNKPRWDFEPEENIRWWDVEAGPVSRVRLAHYARLSGIAKHALNGAIGKTHDVINVASGLTPIEEIKAKSDITEELEFVDYDDFRAILKDSGLTNYGQNQIRQEIEWNLRNQILRGGIRPSRNGEIIVEGSGGWVTRGGNRVPHFEKIAKLSLANLLDSESSTRNVAPREFLAQFA